MEGLSECYVLDNCQGTLGGGCVNESCDGDYFCDAPEFYGVECTGYRLPTEAEWEYLARAGTQVAFAYPPPDGSEKNDNCGCGDEIGLLGHACWCHNSGASSCPVKGSQPNNWGLYDMAGGVSEWCWDHYQEDYYAIDPETDPLGGSGSSRVIRGGSWGALNQYCRSASRLHTSPAFRGHYYGLRVLRSLGPSP